MGNANDVPTFHNGDNAHVVDDHPFVGQDGHVIHRDYQLPSIDSARKTMEPAPYLFLPTAAVSVSLNVLLFGLCCAWYLPRTRQKNRQVLLQEQSNLKFIEATLKGEPDDTQNTILSDCDDD
jgi:hypothetical protein